jgi:hypothetical protein
MSSSLAISAVTETLRKLLDDAINADPAVDPNSDEELAGTAVTVRPPDRARTNVNGRQLNLFLYQTDINAAWRNQEIPGNTRPGESPRPPLPLNLHYLLTAFCPDEEELIAHRLLGRAMSILHDTPVLDRQLIRDAMADNDLYEQFERIRISPQPLNLEELTRLWGMFQTQYRISATYLATVVLIESTLPVRSPLPVLRQGALDRGPTALAGGWPMVHSLHGLWRLPLQPPSASGDTTRLVQANTPPPLARLGDVLVLRGQNLSALGASACFSHPLLSDGIEQPVEAGDAPGEILIRLPAANPVDNPGLLQNWPCGFYQVSLLNEHPDSGMLLPTNQAPFALAPLIAVDPLTAPNGDLTLTVTCRPRVRPEQESKVSLLFGSRQLSPQTILTPDTAPGDSDLPTTLTFALALDSDDIGTHTVRLRVDGVDSLPFALDAQNGAPGGGPHRPVRNPRLTFDTQQQVVIT